ncbi:CinA family protein [Erythrobacter litoralis]|uniref:CinA family protein n=1 Tax=Erythrobacter litoralis TaxID=39960 RepID=UPI0024357FE6|nr:CinA family protein [Erythrobacter litoralis]MDG6078197.1 CinA family protein [Erythrobacter litoralis]
MYADALMPPDIVALAHKVVEQNAQSGRKVVLAESCTGGLVSAALTDIPGSSAVLERGFVTYSNEAKIESLGVPQDLIETFGAVSVACAWAMAKGALEKSRADVAVAISGIAGPGGGTELKPVGTVVFARVLRGETAQPDGEMRHFDSDSRGEIRRQATLCALELLLP